MTGDVSGRSACLRQNCAIAERSRTRLAEPPANLQHDLGSYRGAAAISGVDHKTAKQAVLWQIQRRARKVQPIGTSRTRG
jgi:hypothetical protein